MFRVSHGIDWIPETCPACEARGTLAREYHDEIFSINVEGFDEPAETYMHVPMFACSNCDGFFPDARLDLINTVSSAWQQGVSFGSKQ
jgi:hypothetical protein